MKPLEKGKNDKKRESVCERERVRTFFNIVRRERDEKQERKRESFGGLHTDLSIFQLSLSASFSLPLCNVLFATLPTALQQMLLAHISPRATYL